jgi:peroxiredoxin Q/BCP
MTELKVGNPVPDITLQATGDQTISLSDYHGKKNVVLYFYPKDSTPGCTTEGQDFRDHYEEFQQLDTEILGVSRDKIRSHENFKAKQGFPFELLSDPDEIACNAFDVIKEKKLYGKTYMGIERSTFLIDKTGRLVREWRKVKVKGHVEEVLEAVRELAAS